VFDVELDGSGTEARRRCMLVWRLLSSVDVVVEDGDVEVEVEEMTCSMRATRPVSGWKVRVVGRVVIAGGSAVSAAEIESFVCRRVMVVGVPLEADSSTSHARTRLARPPGRKRSLRRCGENTFGKRYVFSDSCAVKEGCGRKGRKGRWRVEVGVCGVVCEADAGEDGGAKRGAGAKCGVVRLDVA